MRPWHREDIFSALMGAGWSEPITIEENCYSFGESYRLQKADDTITLSFISDLGAGFQGIKSIEEVIALTNSGEKHELYLNQRRDSKWRHAVATWVKELESPKKVKAL